MSNQKNNLLCELKKKKKLQGDFWKKQYIIARKNKHKNANPKEK
jgi:hypothetical protein